MLIKTLRIVKCSSSDREGLLNSRIAELEKHGFKVLFDDLLPDATWPYCASAVQNRLQALTNAFLEDESDAIMWARGGYGASDLLGELPWTTIRSAKPKPIIGFSDVCAAQSALYVMTGRPSIHAPMPASSLWGQGDGQNNGQDVTQLISLMRGTQTSGHFDLDASRSTDSISGKIFGGCLSVLTSLIGTPYLPKNLSGHILMFEDISENPGRVLRMLNQWKQAGYFAGVKALVFGAFTDLGSNLPNNSHILFDEIAKRFDLPIFSQAQFGHIAPNYPFIIGSDAHITKNKLVWKLPSNHQS